MRTKQCYRVRDQESFKMPKQSTNSPSIASCSNIMLRVIYHTLDQESYMDQEITIDLAAFRKGSGARDHIVNLRLIMEISMEYQRSIFVDY